MKKTRRSRTRKPGTELFEVQVAGERLMVLSLPVAQELPGVLSPAEREIALAVMSGLSNAEIARKRGTTPRTVANQVASIYRKLGVSSRCALATRLRGGSSTKIS